MDIWKYTPVGQIVPGDTVAGAAGAAAAITYAAASLATVDATKQAHVITRIHYSYSAAPTGGGITITDGGTTVFQVDITAAGPGSIDFLPPRKFTPGNAVVVTLLAPGGAVVGKLNVEHWTEP